ncbi:MAG: lysozyme [Edaphobacter sp.]
MSEYTYDEAGLTLTEGFEGCKLTAYRDSAGVLTIGFGHTGKDVVKGMTITREGAESLLSFDVQTAAGVVNRLVEVVISQAEFDALVDFAFNAGQGNFASSTLLRKLNEGDFAGAAAEFERWDKAGGQVITGLLRRRLAEIELFDGGGR